jgi:hypothetical protein
MVAAIQGCRADTPNRTWPQIATTGEQGFVDLTFAIESRERAATGGERFVAAGADGQTEVALAITVEPGWTKGKLDGINADVYRGLVTLETTGPRSDRLLQAIDRLYSTNLGVNRMSRATRFVGISLEGNPAALDDAPTKIKLFFESEREDRYAEIFLNLDVRAKTIQLNEKDPDYRKAVILALSGSSK